MKNQNEPSKMVESAAFWFWTDDHTIVRHPAGAALVTHKTWDSYTADTKAKFRPVDANNGLIGYGLVLEDMLFVLLD